MNLLDAARDNIAGPSSLLKTLVSEGHRKTKDRELRTGQGMHPPLNLLARPSSEDESRDIVRAAGWVETTPGVVFRSALVVAGEGATSSIWLLDDC